MDERESRDVTLGERLERFDPPPHGERFWAALEARLAEDADAVVDEAGGQTDGGPLGPLIPALPRPRARRRWLQLAASVAAAAIAVLAILTALPADKPASPEPASAAEVLRAALVALSDAPALRGAILAGSVRDGRFTPALRSTFTTDPTGSVVIESVPLSHDPADSIRSFGLSSDTFDGALTSTRFTYSSRQRELTVLYSYKEAVPWSSEVIGPKGEAVTEGGESPFIGIRAGELGAGDPHRYVMSAPFPLVQLRSFLRLAASGSYSFEETTWQGRQVWMVASESVAYGRPSTTPVRITVDRETRLPVRVRYVQLDGEARELRFDYKPLGEAPADGFYRPAFPRRTGMPFGEGWRVSRHPDSWLQPVAADDGDVAEVPAEPSWVPDGYALSDATRSRETDPDAVQAVFTDPPTVSLAYRRGYDQLFVSVAPTDHGVQTQQSGDGPEVILDTRDPMLPPLTPQQRSAWAERTVTRRLATGYFNGRIARLVIDPGIQPHLWVRSPDFTAVIVGDLSEDEFFRVAESLDSWTGKDWPRDRDPR